MASYVSETAIFKMQRFLVLFSKEEEKVKTNFNE